MFVQYKARAQRLEAKGLNLIFDRGDRYVPASVLDMSETGLRIVSNESTAPGQRIIIFLDVSTMSMPHKSQLQLEGVTVRADDQASGGKAIGLRLSYHSSNQLENVRTVLNALRPRMDEVIEEALPAEFDYSQVIHGAPPPATLEWQVVAAAMRAGGHLPGELAPASVGVAADFDIDSDDDAFDINCPRAVRYAGNGLNAFYDAGGEFAAARVVDISESGALLVTAKALQPGQLVSLITDGPHDEALPFELHAQVVRRGTQPQRVAVRFVNSSMMQKVGLQRYLGNPRR